MNPELAKELHDRLYKRACQISLRKNATFGWVIQETYMMIWDWYKQNDLIPLTDAQIASNGFPNIIMFGVAWVSTDDAP